MQSLFEEYGGVVVAIILFGGVIAALCRVLYYVSNGV